MLTSSLRNVGARNGRAARGIPTAEVVANGILDGVPYGVQRFAIGKRGDTVTGSELWSALGRYGRVINAIPTDDSAPAALFTRFGRDLLSACSYEWRRT